MTKRVDKDPWAGVPAEIQTSHIAAINEGLAAIDRGEIVEHATVSKWVDSLPLKKRKKK